MRQCVRHSLWVLTCIAVVGMAGQGASAAAQDKPRNQQLDTVWLAE